MKRSLIKTLSDWLSKNISETEMGNPTVLINRLYTDATNNPAIEIRAAYKKVENASRGETFLAATIQSSDSFRITMRMIEMAHDNELIKINYHGMSVLNRDGSVHQAGLDDELIVREMNSFIYNLNKKLKKFLPFARIVNESTILFPQISVTRK
ncbi:hypothetical protein [Aequorivita sediminis]|uniref:hypothetical protein n=1 Tax=Aequorivita sediminis TaxID=3073653 RepID=UPI0028A6D6F3|nr:hypothetical protein [Aequorivita sp. F6058]